MTDDSDDLRSGKNDFDEIVRNHPDPLREAKTKGQPQHTAWAQREMIRQFNLGETVNALAIRFRCAESTVKRICGPSTRSRQKILAWRDRIDLDAVHALVQQGLSWEDIGRRYGADARMVRKVYSRAFPSRRTIRMRAGLQP